MASMEILGYGLRFLPRDDGPTLSWQTLPPVGSGLPRMLNVGFRARDGFRWGTVVPRLKGKPTKTSAGVTAVPLGGDGAWMLLHNASDPSQIISIDDADASGAWTIRAHLADALAVDVAWAPLFFFETTPPGALWPFELHGPLEDLGALDGKTGIGDVLKAFDGVPPGTLVIVRGPLGPVAETLAVFVDHAPEGTTIVGRGRTSGSSIDWIEAESRGEKATTIQRHYVLDVGNEASVVVTGQALPEGIDPVREYAEIIATKMKALRSG